MSDLELMTRKPPADMDESALLTNFTLQQVDDAMMKVLEADGVDPAMMKQLRRFDQFGANNGMLMIAMMGKSHTSSWSTKILVDSEILYLRDHYLRNETMPSREKVEWTRSFSDLVMASTKLTEILLQGVQAIAKMQPQDDKKSEKKKPGFRPLVAVKAEPK